MWCRVLVLADDLVEREPGPRIGGTELAHGLPSLRVAKNATELPRDIPSTSPTSQSNPVSPSAHDFGHSAGVGADHRNAGSKRLERAQPERFALMAEGTSRPTRAAERRCRSFRENTHDPRRQAAASRLPPRRGRAHRPPSRAMTESRLFTPRKNPTTSRTRFTRRKLEMCISIGAFRQLLPEQPRMRRAVVDVGVDEVVNHLDVACCAAERV